MSQLGSASLYTDFNGLGELRRGAKDGSPEAIKAVSQQFEAIFVQMMMKSMRDAKLAEGLFDSDQSEQYIDLYDKQLANTLSSQGRGIGLAEVIARQLGGLTQQEEPQVNGEVANIPARLSTLFQLKGSPGRGQHEADTATPSLKLDNALLDKENSTKRAMPTGKLSEPVIASPDDFVQQLWPMAEKAGSSLGVDPKVILAQAALETGWGRSVIRDTNGDSSFNLFNIKSGSDWHGDAIVKNSLEFSDGVGKQERSAFRRYGSYQESFNDYVQFLQSNSRYEKALKQGDSSENYVRELQQAGYATDPDYAAKIELIMNRTQFNTTIDRQISSNGSDNILS